jgi:hypothetical protein
MLVAGNQIQQGSDIQIFIDSSIKMGSFVLSDVFAILVKMQYRSRMCQGLLRRKSISKLQLIFPQFIVTKFKLYFL